MTIFRTGYLNFLALSRQPYLLQPFRPVPELANKENSLAAVLGLPRAYRAWASLPVRFLPHCGLGLCAMSGITQEVDADGEVLVWLNISFAVLLTTPKGPVAIYDFRAQMVEKCRVNFVRRSRKC